MANQDSRKLILADDARIFSTTDDEFRIRKGVWNYTEATLILKSISENSRNTIVKLLRLLDEGKAINIKLVRDDLNLSEVEKENIISIFGTLKEQDYLQSEEDNITSLFLQQLIGGESASIFMTESGKLRPALFFADTQYSQEVARMLADDLGLPLTVMNEKDFNTLSIIDLTTRYDAIETKKQSEEYENLLAPYCCVIGSMERPSISFLRNLNRVLIKLSQTLILSMVDGPFTSLLVIKPPETGCFECFELRLLARMEEMSIYRNFVSKTRRIDPVKERTLLSPITHQLTAAAIFEGMLVSSINRSKLAGRVLNTYIPMMEIQVQDLLRVPFCPACGFIAQSQMSELYTSSKRIIKKMVNKIVIKSEEK